MGAESESTEDGAAPSGERGAPGPLRILLIDNYDSFTYNLVHQIAAVAGQAPVVVHNDWADWEPSVLDQYDAIVLSPGPGDPRVPEDFGICADAIRIAAERRIPLLGVCLGHQGIGHAFGARVRRAPEPRHGRPSPVAHDGTGPFHGLPSPVEVVRYHSLMIDEVPDELVVTARADDDGVVMGVRHRELPLWGVQFHPESIGTHDGTRMVANFVAFARATLAERLPAPGADAVRGDTGATALADVAARPHEREQERLHGTERERPIATEQVRPAPRPVLRRTLPLRIGTAALFTGLFGDAAQAVWLDGGRDGDDRARYSILGGGDDLPTVLADVHAGIVTVRDGETENAIRSGFFDWLDAELGGTVTAGADLPFALGWVGALGYELRAECGSPHRHRAATPDAAMVRLDRAVVVDHREGLIHLLALDDEAWLTRTAERIAEIETASSARDDDVTGPDPDPSAAPLLLAARHSRTEYLRLIAEAQEQISAGETYEACLTNLLHADVRIDALPAYLALRAENPAPFGAFLRIGGVSVLSTSPERFLRITTDGSVESRPIKGTRPRGADADEDERIRAELASSEKDRAENLMIVDLVRHDLGRTAELGSVRVDGLFRVESYATVHQLVSTVRSRLADTPVACVRAAFPPGSMTGAPKLRTMAILDGLEGGPRGLYSGALGYFSFDGAVDLSVIIRTLVVHDGGLDYGVGGAIVSLSDPDDEYAETVVKARPLLRLTSAKFPGE